MGRHKAIWPPKLGRKTSPCPGIKYSSNVIRYSIATKLKSPCYKETQFINSFCSADSCGKNTLLLCIRFYSSRYRFPVSYFTAEIYGTVSVKREALIAYEKDCVSEGWLY